MKYPGSKALLARWIGMKLARKPIYVEPYCGSAVVYLNLPWHPELVILNDLSSDIFNVFQMLREHGEALAELIALTPWSREEYAISHHREDVPNLERARRYLVNLWQAHGTGGDARGSSWSVSRGASKKIKNRPGLWRKLPDRLVAALERLRAANIENRPALEVIANYWSPDAVLYVDPPYPHETRNGRLYIHDTMTLQDHQHLITVLRAHPGAVAISGYTCPLYDTLLADWSRYTQHVVAEKGQIREEVLWTNAHCTREVGLGPLFDHVPHDGMPLVMDAAGEEQGME